MTIIPSLLKSKKHIVGHAPPFIFFFKHEELHRADEELHDSDGVAVKNLMDSRNPIKTVNNIYDQL
jgi:hypothetical protein